MQRKYRLVIHWKHPKWGPQMEKLVANGSSIRRALSSALRDFFRDKSKRDVRRGAHVELQVTIHRTKEPPGEHTRKHHRV